MNRISSAYLSQQSVNYLNQNLSVLSQLQERLSSGKNINRPSDDPIGLTRILNLSNTLNVDERYTKNINDAIAEVNAADNATNSLVSLIHRAQELTTQAANFTNNQTGRDAIALEINQIIDQMVQIGNTDVGGKYIFAGFQTSSPPFTRVSQNVITYAGTPPAQPWQRQIEISQNVTININVNGQNLLGTANGVAGPLPVAVAGSGLFQTMVTLLMDLQAAGDPIQLQEIRNRLDNLSTNLTGVSANQSTLGSISNRLELTKNRNDDRKAIFTQQFAEIQNIDTAGTIANLNYQENIFQASLGVTGRVLQTSLLDFLR